MIISRNDPLYISKMFKSRWQPLPAYIGMIGCIFVVIWSGVPPLYILGAKNGLTSTNLLKPSVSLACDVLGAYSGVSHNSITVCHTHNAQPLLFAIFYLTYKYITPRSFAVDVRDLTPGDYVLGEIAVIEGDIADGEFEPEGPELEAQRWDTGSPKDVSAEFDIYDLEEYETRRAQQEERRRIEEILERRPKRMERRLARELWSCVIADQDGR